MKAWPTPDLLPSCQEFLTEEEMVMGARVPRLRIVGSGRETKLRLVGDREGAPLDGLCQSAHVAGALDKLQRSLVRQARDAGRSWTEIGEALGVSRQSAWQRFTTLERPR